MSNLAVVYFGCLEIEILCPLKERLPLEKEQCLLCLVFWKQIARNPRKIKTCETTSMHRTTNRQGIKTSEGGVGTESNNTNQRRRRTRTKKQHFVSRSFFCFVSLNFIFQKFIFVVFFSILPNRPNSSH